MNPKPHGNGAGKVDIHQHDMGGWLRVHTDTLTVIPDDQDVYLSLALTERFRQRPQLTMLAVVPIVRDGYTIELHAWYSLLVFPDASAQTAEKKEGKARDCAANPGSFTSVLPNMPHLVRITKHSRRPDFCQMFCQGDFARS